MSTSEADAATPFDLSPLVETMREHAIQLSRFKNTLHWHLRCDPREEVAFPSEWPIDGEWHREGSAESVGPFTLVSTFKTYLESLASASGERDPVFWRFIASRAWSEVPGGADVVRALVTGRFDGVDPADALASQYRPARELHWLNLLPEAPADSWWPEVVSATRVLSVLGTRGGAAIEARDTGVWLAAASVIWNAAGSRSNPSLADGLRHSASPSSDPDLVDACLATANRSRGESQASAIVRLTPEDSAYATLVACTRSLLADLAPSTSAIEATIRLLRARVDRSHNDPVPYDPTDRDTRDAIAIYELVRHLTVAKSYGFEAESHRMRAVECATAADVWLPVFAPWIVRAFAEKHGSELIDVMVAAATDEVLDRLEPLVLGPERFSTFGSVVDMIFRRSGRRAPEDDPSDARDLLGPFEPVRGQTWLNDQRIEHVLYEAVRGAESAFARAYTNSWHEHEDTLLRDLFDDVRDALANAVREANVIASTPRDRWGLTWSKFQPVEEKKTGADLALIVEVAARGRLEFRRVCLIQVKAMNHVRKRFASRWSIDRAQLGELLGTTSSAFYLLLTPHVVSAQQRVLPADTVRGMLAASGKKQNLSDAIAAPSSHSLGQFLVHDVLGGWQGSPDDGLIKRIDGREGARVRHLLRVRFTRGEGHRIDVER